MSVSYKNSRIHAAVTQAHKNCDENIRKSDCLVKIFLMEGRNLYGYIRRLGGSISMNYRSMIFHTLKISSAKYVDGSLCIVAQTYVIKLAMAGI